MTIFLAFGPEISYAQNLFMQSLPQPGIPVGLSSAFQPILVKGLVIKPDDPLNFRFVMDSGDEEVTTLRIKQEGTRQAKYFLAAVTIPEKDLWVNLSPLEQDRMIDDDLGQTELGRDMLAQDYILKQLTASVMNPKLDLGKIFWRKVYEKTYEKYGVTDVPTNMFHKVWITPAEAEVFEKGNAVYVTKAHLKVMLESDYVAQQAKGHVLKGAVPPSAFPTEIGSEGKAIPIDDQSLSTEILKEIIIPVLEEEVNQGKNFSPMRQIFHTTILAKWYRESVQDSLMEKAYVGKNKIVGVDVDNPMVKEEIYQKYISAYQKGVVNFIKEERDAVTGEIVPHHYFSGGEDWSMTLTKTTDSAEVTRNTTGESFVVNFQLDSVDQKDKDHTFKKMVSLWKDAEFAERKEKYNLAVTIYAEIISLYEKEKVFLAKKTSTSGSNTENGMNEIDPELEELSLIATDAKDRMEWLRIHPVKKLVRSVDESPGGDFVLSDPITYVEAHNKGTRHGAVHVIVATLDGQIVVKENVDGGLIDISASSQVREKDLTWAIAAKRSMQEELGLSIKVDDLQELRNVKGREKVTSSDFRGLPFYDGQGVFHTFSGDRDNREIGKFFLYILTAEEKDQLREPRDDTSESSYTIKFLPLHSSVFQKTTQKGLAELVQAENLSEKEQIKHLRKFKSPLLQFFRDFGNIAQLEKDLMREYLARIRQDGSIRELKEVSQGISALRVSAVPRVGTTPTHLKTLKNVPGALIFDVDKTLAGRNAQLPKNVRKMLRALSEIGFRIEIVTGQPINVQYPRLVSDIVMKEGSGASIIGGVEKFTPPNLYEFVIRTSEGGQKYIFKNSEIAEVWDYKKGVLAQAGIKAKVFEVIIKFFHDMRNGTISAEEKALAKSIERKLIDEEKKVNQDFDEKEYEGLFILAQDILKTEFPEIFSRDIALGIKIESLSKNSLSKPIRVILAAIIEERLDSMLKEVFAGKVIPDKEAFGLYASEGGSTTINILPRGVTKKLALEDIFEDSDDSPLSKGVYFGDEFMPEGNDYPVVQFLIEEAARTNQNPDDFLILSVGMLEGAPLEPKYTHWIGDGPNATERALEELIAQLKRADIQKESNLEEKYQVFQEWKIFLRKKIYEAPEVLDEIEILGLQHGSFNVPLDLQREKTFSIKNKLGAEASISIVNLGEDVDIKIITPGGSREFHFFPGNKKRVNFYHNLKQISDQGALESMTIDFSLEVDQPAFLKVNITNMMENALVLISPVNVVKKLNDAAQILDSNLGGVDMTQTQVARTGAGDRLMFSEKGLLRMMEQGFSGLTPVNVTVMRLDSPLQVIIN